MREFYVKFNPSTAPNFGGIWESAIKSTKLHLKKVTSTRVYTLEELVTLITRVEGALNFQLLVAMSKDSERLMCVNSRTLFNLTTHLAIPEHNIINIPMNSLKRWQLIRQVLQSFWKRWSREYKNTL